LGDIKELNVDVLLVVNTIYDEFSREEEEEPTDKEGGL